jgi:hypothetical protein
VSRVFSSPDPKKQSPDWRLSPLEWRFGKHLRRLPGGTLGARADHQSDRKHPLSAPAAASSYELQLVEEDQPDDDDLARSISQPPLAIRCIWRLIPSATGAGINPQIPLEEAPMTPKSGSRPGFPRTPPWMSSAARSRFRLRLSMAVAPRLRFLNSRRASRRPVTARSYSRGRTPTPAARPSRPARSSSAARSWAT